MPSMSDKKFQKIAAALASLAFLLLLSFVSAGPADTANEIEAGGTREIERRVEIVSDEAEEAPAIETNALVIRTIDGDTIRVRFDDGIEASVRFLGVDTPETVDPRRPVACFGKEASAFTKRLTEGRRVFLVADPHADEVDKYGRLLRNVYAEDGTDIIAALIREGYGHAYLKFPLDKARKAELARLEEEAREEGRGLWAQGVCDD